MRARLELPAYGTLDELAASIRAQVNTAVANGLLEVDPVRRRSDFDRLKKVAPAASVQRFKDHLKRLAWLAGGAPRQRWPTSPRRPGSPTWPTCAAMRRRRSGRWRSR